MSKRAMGFENMRFNSGHGRCPFFFVALLIVALFFLTCNWWSLTSDNMELMKEMQKLDTQLNQCTKQLSECNFRKESLETQVQQDEETILRSHNSEKMALNELKASKKQREDSSIIINKTQNSFTMCQTELDSMKSLDQSKTATLDSLRIDKETLASQLADKKSKILELEAKISLLLKAQTKPVSISHGGLMSTRTINKPAEPNDTYRSSTPTNLSKSLINFEPQDNVGKEEVEK